MTSQSSVNTSADEASQSPSHISDSDSECALLGEPNTICGKRTADRYWLVENFTKMYRLLQESTKSINVNLVH